MNNMLTRWAAAFGLLAVSSVASAVTVLPGFTSAITITNSNNVQWFDQVVDLDAASSVTQNGPIFNYDGSYNGGTWMLDWNMNVDPDPLIGGSFSITNSTALTQTFDLTFGLPVAFPFSPGVKSGSVGFDFVDTNNSGGATVNLTTWEGLVDGVNAMNLFSSSVFCFGTGCTGSIATIADGPLSQPGGVSSTLGIHLVFSLTAGDTVNFNTSFEVNPVPVPAAAWLFGSGLLGLAGVAARKRNEHV